MFEYKDNFEIKSSVLFKYIEDYIIEQGAAKLSDFIFECDGLVIEVIKETNPALKAFNMEQNTIRILGGDKEKSKLFLDNFRFKFLSAGG